MPEIAKCPLCGEAVSVFYLDDTPVTFSHCGIQANSVELWNRYAAALELAQGYVNNAVDAGTYRILHERVLEVFK